MLKPPICRVGEKNIIEILKEYTEMKLIVYRNNKEEVIELDNIVKSILIGYYSKRMELNKEIY